MSIERCERTGTLLRLAPLFLIGVLGLVVCFLVACGAEDLEDQEEGTTTSASCARGYGQTSALGTYRCEDGYGSAYGRSRTM